MATLEEKDPMNATHLTRLGLELGVVVGAGAGAGRFDFRLGVGLRFEGAKAGDALPIREGSVGAN